MKFSGAVFAAFLTVAPLSAQVWPAGGFGNVVFPAGRAPAGVNPWGNVVTPAIPQGAAALATGQVAGRYGVGAAGRSFSGAGSARRRNGTSSIYAYPVFVGGYGYYGAGYVPADQPAASGGNGSQADQPAQPPVVINQYFNTPPPAQGSSPDANSNFHYYQAPANDSAAPPSDTTYYLIAFKDHTVYSAVAYYTEGDTLHYFTEGNVHNQVSLALVDRQLTEQLNREHNVEVRLP